MPRKKIEVLDFLKGFSILAIVIMHYSDRLDLNEILIAAKNFGGAGIHTFFMISGFGLYLSYSKKPISYPQFLKKRFVKIYFPYIIIVLVTFVINLFTNIYPISYKALFGHIFLYKMFYSSQIETYGFHLWFVSTIIQFYLLFPLIFKLKNKISNAPLLIIGLIISISWGIFILFTNKAGDRVWDSFFLQYLWEFILGIVLADLYLKKGFEFWNIQLKYFLPITIIALVAFPFLTLKFGMIGRTLNDIPALIGFTGFAILVYRIGFKMFNHLILMTGEFSYSLYLIHVLVMELLSIAIVKMGYTISPGVYIIIFAITIILSIWYQKVINKTYSIFSYN